MTTTEDFTRSRSEPDSHLGPALRSLWWARKGDWDRAHEIVQQHEGDPDCDLVHAHLHRQEGNLANARHWYQAVGRPLPTAPPGDEWDAIAAELLARAQPARLSVREA